MSPDDTYISIGEAYGSPRGRGPQYVSVEKAYEGFDPWKYRMQEIGEDGSVSYIYSSSGDFLAEYSCNNHQGADFYECPNGCEVGACVIPQTGTSCGTTGNPDECCKNQGYDFYQWGDNLGCVFAEEDVNCDSGCILNNKCYDYGYRKNGQYCSDLTDEFVDRKGDDSFCDNDFECISNLCIDDQCVEAGFFKKIMNWFGRLFG